MAYTLETIKTEIATIKTDFGSGRDMIRNAIDKIYRLLCLIKSNLELQAHLSSLYNVAGLKTQKSTDAATKLVRLTISLDRKKANPYAKVFRRALQAKVTPDEFLGWLDKHGGIERVRLSKLPLPIDGDKASEAAYEAAKAEAQRAAKNKVYDGMQHIAAQTSKAVVKSDKAIEFDGNVALLVVYRRIDDLNSDLTVVEILGEKTADAKAVFRRHAVMAAEESKNNKAAT